MSNIYHLKKRVIKSFLINFPDFSLFFTQDIYNDKYKPEIS